MFNCISRLIETYVAHKYSERFNKPFLVAIGSHKAWDIASLDYSTTIEVKFDTITSRTNNLCFEVAYDSKPSGLISTEAQLWCSSYPLSSSQIQVYEFSVPKLREELENYSTTIAGYQDRTLIKLLPLTKANLIVNRKFSFTIDWSAYRPYWVETNVRRLAA